MVLGVGVDLVDIARFERALTRTPRLKQRLFGDIDLLDSEISAQSLAARFAAKEAALKALGGNIFGFSWRDIQVSSSRGERPSLVLSGGALARAQSLLASDYHLSLTHDAGMAMAFVVMEARA